MLLSCDGSDRSGIVILLHSLMLCLLLCTCQSLATPSSQSSIDIDTVRLVEIIRSGRAYQHENFLSQEEIEWLFTDMKRLEAQGSFTKSGLSDTSRGRSQGFGNQDRSVSAVPWWSDTLRGNIPTDNVVARRMQELRYLLADALDRPTLRESDLDHECYYSTAGPGSFLPRHMDDKHEDLKGSKGWLLPSRRSLSWLLYLSDPADWDLPKNGGALRTFPPENLVQGPQEPTHEGNLQIGWLNRKSEGSVPVYMDSWFRHEGEPHAVLYTVQGNKRQFLTHPWLNDNLPVNVLTIDFIKEMATRDATVDPPILFLRRIDARNFSLIWDQQAWDRGHDPAGSVVQDIAPLKGSLVVFDSILLPHQVEEVYQGQRIALAGWFHERTQEFPQDLYPTMENEL